MIIPSIDLMRGSTVQLVGGEELAIEAGDPRPLLDRFSRVGETAVIDLDAATGEGSNEELITELCRRGPVRVGGGIRDLAANTRNAISGLAGHAVHARGVGTGRGRLVDGVSPSANAAEGALP